MKRDRSDRRDQRRNGAERRIDDRLCIRLRTEYKKTGKKKYLPAQIVDLSSKGIGLVGISQFRKGERLRLRLYEDQIPIYELVCKVTWSRPEKDQYHHQLEVGGLKVKRSGYRIGTQLVKANNHSSYVEFVCDKMIDAYYCSFVK
jgi:hypothetical protein